MADGEMIEMMRSKGERMIVPVVIGSKCGGSMVRSRDPVTAAAFIIAHRRSAISPARSSFFDAISRSLSAKCYWLLARLVTGITALINIIIIPVGASNNKH